MAEVVLKVGTKKVAARDFDPTHPFWFVAYEHGQEPSSESVFTLDAHECPEPTEARCAFPELIVIAERDVVLEVSVIDVSSTGVLLNFPRIRL